MDISPSTEDRTAQRVIGLRQNFGEATYSRRELMESFKHGTGVRH